MTSSASWRLNILCIKFKIIAFFSTTLLVQLNARVYTLILCRKHLSDLFISLRGGVCVHKGSYWNVCSKPGHSPRFLCRPTAFFFARAVGRQRALHKENSGFASPTLGRHISTFCDYRIVFSIRNLYINRFTNHFSIHS
jgi:hypothetical protein